MKNKFQRFFILLLAVVFLMQQPLCVSAVESDVSDDTKVRVSLLGKYDSADIFQDNSVQKSRYR